MRYWLVKSEPDDFSLEDLKNKPVEPWTGVRNYLARNHMREMAMGDQVLFYHSNIQPMGIVGIAEVASELYPDPTQFDPNSDYFDPKATKETPRWQLVDLKYVAHLSGILTLPEIKQDPILSEMLVAKTGQRLSVQPVSEDHYQRVLALRPISA